MIKFTNENIIAIHELISKETGGDPNLRDKGLLESSIEQCFQTAFGEECYKTDLEKSVRLGFALTSNHPFVDGNKRIGVMAMLAALELNGIKHRLTNEDIYDIGMKLANSKLSYEDLLNRVKESMEVTYV